MSDMNRKPQTEQKHPDEWQRDLNPDRMAGQNIGRASQADEVGVRSAKDSKRRGREFTATREMTVAADQAVVPKDRVPYRVWNRLIGEEKP